MATENQINANRANAAKSTGPVTPSGKQKAACNSTRHGLLARTIVMIGESRARFYDLLCDLETEFQPQNRVEEILVEKMVAALWRQRRIWAMENAGISHEVVKQGSASNRGDILKLSAAARAGLAFRSFTDQSRALEIMNRYDTRYDNQYQRALNQLIKIREKKSVLPNEPNFA